MGQPRPLFHLFCLFKQTFQFLQQKCVKKWHDQQVTAPRFEPTTFGTWVSSHNHETRAFLTLSVSLNLNFRFICLEDLTPRMSFWHIKRRSEQRRYWPIDIELTSCLFCLSWLVQRSQLNKFFHIFFSLTYKKVDIICCFILDPLWTE